MCEVRVFLGAAVVRKHVCFSVVHAGAPVAPAAVVMTLAKHMSKRLNTSEVCV
jgi:hypothetical protein